MSNPIILDQGASLRPPPGLDVPGGLALPPFSTPQISSPSARSAIAGQQVGDMASMMERAAMYSGEIEEHFRSIRDQTKEMHRSTSATAREVRGAQHSGYRESPVSSGQGVRAHTAGPAGMPEGGAPGGHGDRFRDMDFGQGRDIGENMADLRQNVARRTNRWMSEWGNRNRPEVDAAGQYLDAEAGQAWERGMSRVGRVQGGINAIGEGKGLSGMLGKVGGRFAGPIGVAVGAGLAANDQMIKQRHANAYYQNIYGGSQTDAAGERGKEWAFSRLGTAGLMDSEEAEQLFRGVSAMGLNGSGRQRALDFATGNYRNSGMSTETSMKMIEQATENGIYSMTGLTDAIDQVGAAAEKSHKPLKAAQEALAGMYSSLSGSFSNNAATAGIAGGLVSMQQGLGHRLGSLDFGSMVNSPQQQMMMASMLGMDPSTFQMQAQTNQNDVLGKGMNEAFSRIREQGLAPGSADSIKGLAAELKAKNGGKLSEDAYGELGRKLLSTGGNNPMRAKAIASAMGVNLTDAQVPEFMARLALGDSALDAEKALGSNDLGKGYTDVQSGKIKGEDLSTNRFFGNFNAQNERLEQDLGINRDKSKSVKSLSTYEASLHKEGGKRYKSIENLLRGEGTGDDTKIRVKDASGKDVDVTLEQAIKYHKDALEEGNLQITAGKNTGKTVGDVTGVFKKPGAGKGNEQTKVTVEAKGALKDFITLQVSGGASLDLARRAGQPAPAFTSPWVNSGGGN